MMGAAVFVAGVVAGAAVNAARYCLAWTLRRESPWSKRHPQDAKDGWIDRAPVLGWIRLRRKAPQLGRGFWLRAILVEVVLGAAFVGLYHFEVTHAGLTTPQLPNVRQAAIPQATVNGDSWTLHSLFIAHALLLTLMAAASLIDIDEQTIPDAITVFGALAGLILAAALPSARLPAHWISGTVPQQVEWLSVVTPQTWPPVLAAGAPVALGIALACYGLWCVALLPRRFYGRRGFRRAMQLMGARIVRDRSTPRIAAIALVGAIGISAIWWVGGARWIALLSAIVGMAAGASLIWSVRILASWALRKEAMGFGDVTLMAMIGAFLGWQPCLMIFFVAPLAGLVVGVVQMALRGDTVIPYGPFLCLATGGVVLRWLDFWSFSYQMFEFGWLLPSVFSVCLVMMAILLFFWRKVKEAWGWE